VDDGRCEASTLVAIKLAESSTIEILMRSVNYREEVGYVWRPWGIHIDIVRDRGSKGMDRCPLTRSRMREVDDYR
jgi:hypothetical protein